MHPPINSALSTVIVLSSHQDGQSCGRGWAVINETLLRANGRTLHHA